jgi:predicted ATPase
VNTYSPGFRLNSIQFDESHHVADSARALRSSLGVPLEAEILTSGAFADQRSVTSVLIGANGTGKSRIMRGIAESFIAIENYLNGEKPHRDFVRATVEFEHQRTSLRANIHRKGGMDVQADGRSVIDPRSSISLPARIVALTMTPFDKFPLPRRGRGPLDSNLPAHQRGLYRYLGLRDQTGRSSTLALLYRLVENLAAVIENDGSRKANVDSVFELLGYEPSMDITYEVRGSSSRALEVLDLVIGGMTEAPPESRGRSDRRRPDLERSVRMQSLIDELGEYEAMSAVDELTRLLESQRPIEVRFDFSVMRSSARALLIRALHQLRTSLGISLRSIVVRRKNDGTELDLRSASSGEMSILVTFVALASAIADESLVLIDEPEISLHPEWQTGYLDLLNRAFSSYRGCHYIVATHSPLIISDLDGARSSVVSLDGKGIAPAAEMAGKSSDELLVNAFGVIGNDNLYVKQQLLHAFRLLSDGLAGSEEFVSTLETLLRARNSLADDDAIAQMIDQLEAAPRFP